MESAALLGFARRLDLLDDDYYLRLRAGETRKRAEVIASGIGYGGDPAALVREVFDRIDAYDDPDAKKIWVECIRRKSSTVLDIACISLPDTPVEPPDGSGQEDAIRSLTNAVLALAHDANERCTIAQERFLGVCELYMESAVAQREAEVLLSMQRGDDHDEGIGKAIEMFAPLVPVLAARLLPGKPGDASEGEGEGTEAAPVVAAPKKRAVKAPATTKKRTR